MARTPEPPYTAVIFTSVRTRDDTGYARMMERMVELVTEQPGYLGHDAFREGDRGINVSYWTDASAAAAWKQVHEHTVAQHRGRAAWYADYSVRIATVERAYGM
ncbi:MAG: antibiotic biosynthesis monooxygenase [Marmoricola sp.]|nr:antibiotic biosynthesis monooxygenase [Marmoricola sp.]